MAFRMSEQPRTIKIYNLLAGTNEFIGEGDAYIPVSYTHLGCKFRNNVGNFGGFLSINKLSQ